MENKNELVDIIKYLLGYILKENETLKKENKELHKKVAAHDAEESIIKMASNKLLDLVAGETIGDDDDDGSFNA